VFRRLGNGRIPRDLGSSLTPPIGGKYYPVIWAK